MLTKSEKIILQNNNFDSFFMQSVRKSINYPKFIDF